MSDLHAAFISKSFLRSHWDLEYRARHDSENEKALDDRLALWAERTDLKETSAESAFIDVFFRETWGRAAEFLEHLRPHHEVRDFILLRDEYNTLAAFVPNGSCWRRPFPSRNGRPARNFATRSVNWPRTTAPR